MSLNISIEDLNNIEDSAPKADFSPLPRGNFCVEVQEVSDASRENRNGEEYQFVKVKCRVAVGDHTNRVLFGDFIYSHPNQAAADIGVKKLKTLYVAAGCSGSLTVPELSKAVGKCLKVYVGQKEFNNKVRNELSNFAVCDMDECKDGACGSGGSPEASGQSSDDIFG